MNSLRVVKLDLENLADIDPARVPLPIGTDVETRAIGMLGEKRIPLGAVGRVRGRDGDRVVVDIVGVGEVTYPRAELAPRKAGQLRFAVRRESLWRSLKPNVIIETVVGSRAWGLADEHSDTDLRGVFAVPMPWSVGLGELPGELVSIDGSETYWELGKAIRQGLRADPNTLEMLHVPGAQAVDEIGRWLLEGRDAFVSAEIYGSFGRYALGQLKRLRQSLRLAEHRGLLLEWLRDEPTMKLDAAAARLASSAALEATSGEAAVLRAKEYIKQLYSSLFDRGLLASRDYASLAVFALSSAEQGAMFELPRELRPKNAYNLLRLIDCATRWLTTGVADFVVAEPLRTELLAIKRGEVELSLVLARADELAKGLEEARRTTKLPAKPDVQAADDMLCRIRTETARRYVQQTNDPFGANAAPRPTIAFKS